MGIVERETGEYKRNGDPKTEKVRAQVREHVFVYVDEGEALTRMTERSGSTIGPVLRSGWAGQLLGQANAREENTRILPARSYSLGVVMGFQRHTCQGMLADATAIQFSSPIMTASPLDQSINVPTARRVPCVSNVPFIPGRAVASSHPRPFVAGRLAKP